MLGLGLGLNKGNRIDGGGGILLYSSRLESFDDFTGTPSATNDSIVAPSGVNIPLGANQVIQRQAGANSDLYIQLAGDHIEELYTTFYLNIVDMGATSSTSRVSYLEFGAFAGADIWEINQALGLLPDIRIEGPFDAGPQVINTDADLNRWYKYEVYHKVTADENILKIYVDGSLVVDNICSPSEGPNLRSTRLSLTAINGVFDMTIQIAGLTMHTGEFVDPFNT